jgi:N-acetylmuramoyl-L-alanine amidase
VGDWYRVDLGPCRSGWMTAADVSLQAPKPTVLIPVPLIKTQATAENRTLIRVPLREPVPVLIESDQDRLNISLVNTVSQCDFIQYDPADRLIREIVWRQETDRVVTLRATVSGLSGYDYGYENGELVISVKTLPQSVSATRILLDPGHGGAETGGTDPTGIPEKTLNLSLALQVEDALKQAGFQVILTRRDDRDVSLQERQRLALEHQADIILSLHHNALPDGRRPEDIKGICTFYYHPFALPLAKQLQHGLVNGLNRPDYGVFYDSLYLTRIHQALSLLLEFGFMTHPEEADILRDPAFQRQVAQTLCESLLRFLKP